MAANLFPFGALGSSASIVSPLPVASAAPGLGSCCVIPSRALATPASAIDTAAIPVVIMRRKCPPLSNINFQRAGNL